MNDFINFLIILVKKGPQLFIWARKDKKRKTDKRKEIYIPKQTNKAPNIANQ